MECQLVQGPFPGSWLRAVVPPGRQPALHHRHSPTDLASERGSCVGTHFRLLLGLRVVEDVGPTLSRRGSGKKVQIRQPASDHCVGQCRVRRQMNSNVVSRVARWLAEAESAVAFTGAGISTESGIPDFRSPGGIWSKSQPVYFDEFLRSADARIEYWRQK